MSLRPIRPTDVAALVELCAEHAEFERAEYRPDGQAERLAKALFTDSPRLFAWLVEIDGRPMGFAAVSFEYSTWSALDYLHLDCLYLRTEARGQGWGSKLFETVVEHAQSADCRELQWQTPPWNENAIAFYDGKGAVAKPKMRYTLPIRRQYD